MITSFLPYILFTGWLRDICIIVQRSLVLVVKLIFKNNKYTNLLSKGLFFRAKNVILSKKKLYAKRVYYNNYKSNNIYKLKKV